MLQRGPFQLPRSIPFLFCREQPPLRPRTIFTSTTPQSSPRPRPHATHRNPLHTPSCLPSSSSSSSSSHFLCARQQPTAMGIHMQGRCVCDRLRYSLDLDSAEDARATLCHCRSCRRAFGTNYGLTAKVPLRAFRYEGGARPRLHKQENGVTREFCDNCGAFICEYGEEAADKFRYVMWGSLDEPEKIPPKGEFFCKSRAEWMPEIPGVFHKKEIKE